MSADVDLTIAGDVPRAQADAVRPYFEALRGVVEDLARDEDDSRGKVIHLRHDRDEGLVSPQ